MKDLVKDIDFINELENMKKTLRKTKVVGTDRFENDAEHSWHVTMMALILNKYKEIDADLNRTLEMLLVHDIVELYAGDTYAYDSNGYKDKLDREKKAMEKIKEQLSQENAKKIEELWLEFEEVESEEAKFANSMDRLQPVFLNASREDGGTWKEHGIKKSQVVARLEAVKDFNVDLYSYSMDLLDESVDKGYLING